MARRSNRRGGGRVTPGKGDLPPPHWFAREVHRLMAGVGPFEEPTFLDRDAAEHRVLVRWRAMTPEGQKSLDRLEAHLAATDPRPTPTPTNRRSSTR